MIVLQSFREPSALSERKMWRQDIRTLSLAAVLLLALNVFPASAQQNNDIPAAFYASFSSAGGHQYQIQFANGVLFYTETYADYTSVPTQINVQAQHWRGLRAALDDRDAWSWADTSQSTPQACWVLQIDYPDRQLRAGGSSAGFFSNPDANPGAAAFARALRRLLGPTAFATP